jgi:hypothetical protein
MGEIIKIDNVEFYLEETGSESCEGCFFFGKESCPSTECVEYDSWGDEYNYVFIPVEL